MYVKPALKQQRGWTGIHRLDIKGPSAVPETRVVRGRPYVRGVPSLFAPRGSCRRAAVPRRHTVWLLRRISTTPGAISPSSVQPTSIGPWTPTRRAEHAPPSGSCFDGGGLATEGGRAATPRAAVAAGEGVEVGLSVGVGGN